MTVSTDKVREQNFVSAVVYLYNDEPQVESFIKMLAAVLSGNFEKYEIILVNDFSSDNTVEMVKRAMAGLPGTLCSIVNLSYYHGIEAAMIAGVDLAIGDFIYEFDTIVTAYTPDMIMEVYKRSLQGYDVVSAVPDLRERFSSRLFYGIFKRYSSNHFDMQTEHFRIISRRGLNRINMLSMSVPYRKAIYHTCGLRISTIKFVPIKGAMVESVRMFDKSGERMSLALDTLLIYTDIGIRIAEYMAMTMLLTAILILGYALFTYLTYAQVVEGWTTTIFFIAVLFAGTFALMAVLIKYVDLILHMLHTRKTYVFESIEKLK